MGTGCSRRLAALVGLACLVAVAAFAATAAASAAAEVRSGQSPTVDFLERIDDDLYLFGGEATIDGTVQGDVVASTGTLKVPGEIEGSLTAAAGRIEIDGDVRRTVRVAGGDVEIGGEVGGDLVVAGGTVTLTAQGSVAGDVIVAGGNLEILGPVTGDVRGNVGDLTLNARIGGDVKVKVSELDVGARTRVAGDLRYVSREEAEIADGATVTGTTRHSRTDRFYPGDNVFAWLTSPIFRLLCALMAGLLVVLVMPRAAATVADGVRGAPLRSFLMGLLLLIFLPVLLVILMITVVGIPIALIGLAFYLCALYLSQVFLGLALGRIVLPKGWDTTSRGYNLLAMTLGVVVLSGLRLIPVPVVDPLIGLLTAIFGLGAVAIGPRLAPRATRAAAGYSYPA